MIKEITIGLWIIFMIFFMIMCISITIDNDKIGIISIEILSVNILILMPIFCILGLIYDNNIIFYILGITISIIWWTLIIRILIDKY